MLKFRVVLSLVLGLLPCHAAEFLTGQAARAVIGQTTFVSQTNGGTESTFSGVGGLAFAGNTLFAADANRLGLGIDYPRVLLFGNIRSQLPGPTDEIPPAIARCPLCGGTATTVLGDKDSGSVPIAATTATGFRLPVGVASDGTAVAVADTANNRVMLWKSTPTSNLQPADIVLGQPDFKTENAQPISASSMRGPQGVWIQNGKVFVADTGNSRVLIWNSFPTRNNQPADLVLGQPNFTTTSQVNIIDFSLPASASALLSPTAVTSDGTKLFVADLGFNRVLIWNSIPTSNQKAADIEIGQKDMTTSVANDTANLCAATGTDSNNNPTYPFACAKTLNFPRFALADDQGRLYVADGGNDRVLVFNHIPTANGAAADAILGQPDEFSDVVTNPTGIFFSANPTTVSAANVTPTPTSLAWDGTNLYVADPTDYRVLVFTPAEANVPTNGVVNFASRDIFAIGSITISGTIVAGNVVTVTITASSGAITVTANGATLTGGSSTNKAAGTFTVAGTTITPGNVATVTIGGKSYTYTAVSGDTIDTIATGLVNAINAANSGAGDPNATVAASGASITVTARNTGDTGNAITISGTAAYTYTVLANDTLDTVAKGLATAISSSNGGAGDPNVIAIFEPNQSLVVLVSRIAGEAGNNIALSTLSSTGTVTMTVTASSSTFNGGSGGNKATATVVVAGTAVTPGNVGSISIGGTTYTYTAKTGDTLNTVASGLVAAITSANSGAGDPNATAAASASTITLTARTAGDAGNGITLGASASAAGTTVATTSASTLTGGANAGNLAPGAFVTIRGQNLADIAAAADQSAGQLPWELAGAEVYVDGDRAPLFYASPTEIHAQIPWEVVNSTSVSIYVRTRHLNGNVTISNAIAGPINPGSPGLFAADGSEPRMVQAYHASSFATGTITVTGTVQGGDVPQITIGDRNYTYTVASGANVTLTARNLGTAGNSVSLAASTSGSSTVTVTASGTTLTGGSSGARAAGTVAIGGTVTVGNIVTTTIGGKSYSYTVITGDTLATIASGLVNVVNSAGDVNVTASSSTNDSLQNISQKLIDAINGNPEEVVTASLISVGTGLRLTAKIPGPEGNGIPIAVTSTTASTNTSGSLIVLTPTNSVTCCANIAGAPVTSANPAVAGETIFVYATGLGLVCTPANITPGDCIPANGGGDPAKDALVTGGQYHGPAENVVTTPVTANVAGGTTTTISAGVLPGTFGVYRVVFELPSTLSANPLARIYLSQSFATSNIATIPIGPPLQ